MVIRNSSDLVYKSFKKLDTCVVVCIWTIFLFSFAVLTGQYFLYKYLKPKISEKDLFLYLFSAVLVFYFSIILAGFYILSTINDYKTQESNFSNSVLEVDDSQLQENDFENTISINNQDQNDLLEINPDVIEQQQNQAIPQIYPSLSQACSRSCPNTNSSTVEEMTSEIEMSSLNTENCFVGNYKDNKCNKNMQNVIAQNIHLFIEMCIDEYELRKNTIRKADLFYHQHLRQTNSRNHIANISEPNQIAFDPVLYERETNVAETRLVMPSNYLLNDNHLNGMSHSNRNHFNGRLIPQIIIEGVDNQISTRSNLQRRQSFETGKLLPPSIKKSLDTSKEAIKSVASFNCGTYRPIEMSYNIVGLPELIPTHNGIESNKNISNDIIHSKKQLEEDSNNQRLIKCELLERI